MANAAGIIPLDQNDPHFLAHQAAQGLFHQAETEVADSLLAAGLAALGRELGEAAVCKLDRTGAVLFLSCQLEITESIEAGDTIMHDARGFLERDILGQVGPH